MREVGVDVISIVNVDRAPDFKPKEADLIVCLKDFMSHGAFDVARAVARKYGRPFLALTRKSADWEDKLSKFMPQLRHPGALQGPGIKVVELPPRSSRHGGIDAGPLGVGQMALVNREEHLRHTGALLEPEPESTEDVEEASPAEYQELLGMFEAENVRLQDESRQLTQRLAESDALAASFERQLEQLKRRCEDLEEKAQLIPPPKTVIDKQALLTWDRLLRGVRDGRAPDFHALLEFSVLADISANELLDLLKG